GAEPSRRHAPLLVEIAETLGADAAPMGGTDSPTEASADADPIAALRVHWDRIAPAVAAARDVDGLARLIPLARRLHETHATAPLAGEPRPGARSLLERGLGLDPAHEGLHREFWRSIGQGAPSELLEAAQARMRELA